MIKVDLPSYKLKGIRAADKLQEPSFYYPNHALYEVEEKMFIKVRYDGPDSKELSKYNASFMGKFTSKRNPMELTYEPLESGWSMTNGDITYKDSNRLPFTHISQILVKNGYEDKGEATLQALEDSGVAHEYLPVYFDGNNIKYYEYASLADTWVFSQSNNNYYNGTAYHYSIMEGLALPIIKRDYPEVYDDYPHKAYGNMMRLAVKNGLIEKEDSLFPFELRVRLANFLKLAP